MGSNASTISDTSPSTTSQQGTEFSKIHSPTNTPVATAFPVLSTIVPSMPPPPSVTNAIAPTNIATGIPLRPIGTPFSIGGTSPFSARSIPLITPSSIVEATALAEINASSEDKKGGSADGFKWRKYGQKNVKGQRFPRNYYKCTFPGCQVKKYVEQVEEGGKVIERVSYKGDHQHDQSKAPKAEPTPSALPPPPSAPVTPPESFNSKKKQAPQVVEVAEAEEDGYHWRKYGQKFVKGSTSPRSYYRCTEENCPAKKHVERRGNQLANVYEGTHNHMMPSLETEEKKKRKKEVSELEVADSDEEDL